MYAYKEECFINLRITENELKNLLPERPQDSHKGTYGRVLMIAGSPGMAGAAYLAGTAAYRSGCGLVEIFTHEANRVIIQQLLPEAVMTLYEDDAPADLEAKLRDAVSGADAVGIGCGLGLSEQAAQIVRIACEAATEADKPLLIDADAITLLGRDEALLQRLSGKEVLVTPHPKEMTALTKLSVADIQADRPAAVSGFCARAEIHCLLKGHRTLVLSSTGTCYENHTGNSALATGGSGDVLSGLITGLAAQGMDLYLAACAGAWIHGYAGELEAESTGERSVMARDLLDGIAEALWEIDEDEEDDWDEDDE